MPDISVVICTYSEDRWSDLFLAIQSVLHQTLSPREIIVVVDHNPRLLERVRGQVGDIRAVENRGECGLSSARNAGVAAARGEIVAFIDDDAVADSAWLAALTAPYADSSVTGVGGRIEPSWLHGRPRWFPEEFDWVVGCTYRGMPAATSPVRNIIGCNMSFRREVFTQVGPFRTGIGRRANRLLGCEETHFCIALSQRLPHLKVLYEPAARVWHRVSALRSCWRYFRSRCYAEGLSKALISTMVGANVGLATERGYAARTLPAGVLTGLTDAALRHDLTGLSRSAAIVGGLALTTAGYVHGRLMSQDHRREARARTIVTMSDRVS